MTYSELLYFYKINKHHEKFNILKKKFQAIFKIYIEFNLN